MTATDRPAHRRSRRAELGPALDRVGRALAQAERDGTDVAVISVGVDDLVGVAAERGEEAREAVLVAVADRLRRSLRAGDSVVRVGDEFFVVVGEVSDDAVLAATSARVAWGLDRPFRIDGVEQRVTVGQGVACREAGESVARLLDRAVAARGRAQSVGHGRADVVRGTHVPRHRTRADFTGLVEPERSPALLRRVEQGLIRSMGA